ncbi:hypothetical protein T459_02087 [Capsicum annuum]|uniref:ATP-sulfurylase PUA-like domain-containing protein n=1 Tax=Capsicum annuum TaxID=4072 RepID=A0A2G3AIY6_CAPAN|nr:hypothetical protein T459_02087 [Capsicum annuum]
MLSEGWTIPLKGFIRELEFLQTLHFNSLRLVDDDRLVVNMSMLIVLAIDDLFKNNVGDSTSVALVDDKDKPISILNDVEMYKHNKEERIPRTWGTTSQGLPYAEKAINHAKNWLIGGDLEVIEPISIMMV